ncbi:MAG: hypothetical protein JO112_05780, partial [Planctomycetes bacterium]|nr:hypothetical protein [Planctomycetota bacterium]
MVERLIESLPFADQETSLRIPQGPALTVPHNQIIVWMSLTPKAKLLDPHPTLAAGTRRFPALLDTGFNDCLLLHEEHLRQWALLEPEAFPPAPLGSMRVHHRPDPFALPGATELPRPHATDHPYRQGWLWLHRPTPQSRDLLSDLPAVPLFLFPGLVILPASFGF